MAGAEASALTDEQADAVARRREPLLLSAAAGSGKTSVLVERFVAAVREDGVAPGRILAITFTERAAGELSARVRARLVALGEREAARDAEAAFIGTFHGFCARLLRAHALAAGVDPAFAILDEALAARLRERAFAAALREQLAGPGPGAGGERAAATLDLTAAYGVDRVRMMIEQVYAELRSRGQRRPQLPGAGGLAAGRGACAHGDADDGSQQERRDDLDAALACGLLDELLRDFGARYERLKQARAAVDFDDLELLARELLLEREGVRALWSERFELLMVDEFQDTNPRQLAILRALERGNLFTVGDELQSIYGFRHADVSLFQGRRAELERAGASLRLSRNFRSRAGLLEAVNAVFSARFAGYSPLLAGREHTQASEPAVELLLTDAGGWERSEELAAALAAGMPRAQAWRQAEARLLAQRVAQLVSEGRASAGEVVVLLRAAGDLEVFERALQLAGLRTLAAVGAFWEHEQVADLIAYLRVLANPLDEQALYGALASPLCGCSLDALAALAAAARAGGRSAWAALGDSPAWSAPLGPGQARALSSAHAWLSRERGESPRRSIGELIERALYMRGYREHVLALAWPERRLANAHKLLRLARRFEAGEGRDLRAFLDHVQHLAANARAEPDAPVEGAEPDAVRLMTVHAAKGLEFPVVCLADLGRQPNTQAPDLLVEGEQVGLRLMRLDGARSRPTLAYEQLCTQRREREAEEEDRILYVAMTRARELLILSGAVEFSRWPAVQRQAPAPIAWLGPALSPQLPALTASGATGVHDLALACGADASVRCLLSSAAAAGEVLRLDAPAAQAPPAQAAQAPPAPAMQAPPAPAPAPASDRAAATGSAPAPAAAGPFSYTSLSELERCGYRYYLERVLGLPEDSSAARGERAGGGLEARARGTLVHSLMETIELGRARPPSSEQVRLRARSLGMRVGAEEAAQLAGLIAAAASSELPRRLASAAWVRREHPFVFAAEPGGTLVTGTIDLLAEERSGGLLVLDYKSDRIADGEDLAAVVAREYDVQRELYALAVLRGGAREVEVVHWFLERPHEWVGVRYRAEQRGALEAGLARRLRGALAQRFEVSSRPHRGLCLTCPGRVGLCSWSEAETLRENT
ncbi:MAG TPA: UvrD-helicase domain-containing protein [Solirubrobacteraceae bacterium]|nr:UvrD-helicase domain-containing protein [Solirubrobacteraceae bacterium]